MLVLSRKSGESIQIGNSVVTVVRINGDRVRLGIQATEDTEIWRTELMEQVDGVQTLPDLAEV